MTTKEILYELRKRHNMTQQEFADRLFVTRQAVSRWELGETVPNTETLKLISKEFDISVNTLLGAPKITVCQCCGMPLEDGLFSTEPDGQANYQYCKWCYADGEFAYKDIDVLIDFLVNHMQGAVSGSEAEKRMYFKEFLMSLDYWKNIK